MQRGVINLSKIEIEEILSCISSEMTKGKLLSAFSMEGNEVGVFLSEEEIEEILDGITDINLRKKLNDILNSWRS